MNSAVIARRAITCIKTHFPHKKFINSTNLVRNFTVTARRNMKLVQFVYRNNPGEIRAGIWEQDGVVDINKADSSLPSTVLDILRNQAIDKVKK